MEPKQEPAGAAETKPPLTRGLSRLEHLPAEIIQKIFLHSLEVNLPRASIHIARILSVPIIYTWLIRLAFSNSNRSSHDDFFTEDFLPAPLDYFALSRQERAALQSTVLECRWCTLPLMRKCQREYIEHVIRRKCSHLIISPADAALLQPDSLAKRFVNLADCDHGSRSRRRGKGDLIIPSRTPPPANEDRRLTIWFHFGAVQIREPSVPSYYERDLFRLPSCGDCELGTDTTPFRMPDKLLSPPWTDAKVEFLELLACDAYIDQADDDCIRSQRVLLQLIQSRDFRTFERLLRLRIRANNYKYRMDWPVLPSHIKAVVKHADSSTKGHVDPFAQLLVDTRWEEISRSKHSLYLSLLSLSGVNESRLGLQSSP